MKAFFKIVLRYLAILFILLVVFDGVYTLIYYNSFPKNKVQFVLNTPPKHYDVIILGSSRAEDHIVTDMFKKQGIDAYNLGITSSNLSENSLLLELFFEKGNTVDKILLQLDTNFQVTKPGEGIKAYFLPYLPFNQTIYRHYLKFNKLAVMGYKYIPFYRYCARDAKIGFREVASNVLKRRSIILKNDGFKPLTGTMQRYEKFELDKTVIEKNPQYDLIVSLCKSHHVDLIRFTTPICSYVTNRNFFSKLKKIVPELYDYSNVVQADSLFSSCGHLNENGARYFTDFLLRKHFGKVGEPIPER